MNLQNLTVGWLIKKGLFLIILFSFNSIWAQQSEPKALKILDEMSKKYQLLKSFKAEFSYQLESPASGVKDNYKGEITVRGDKFYLKFGDQEIINNGATVWTYLKDQNEVTISAHEQDENEISPTKIHTMYKKGFKCMMNDEANENKALYEVVDLIPENKNKKIFKIRIVINKKDKSVKSWKVFEKTGNKYLYSVSKFTPNPVGVDDKTFIFDKTKHKGCTIVNLTD